MVRARRTDRGPAPSGSAPAGCRHGTRPRCRLRRAACAAVRCTIVRRPRCVQTVFLLASTALSFGRRTPLQRRAAALTLPAFGRWPEQIGVQPQPGDHADMAADSGKQAQRREAAVGDEDQTAIGQPAFGLQDRLASPVGQRLVPLAMCLAPSRGRGKDRQERQSPRPAWPRVSAQQPSATASAGRWS